MKILIVEDQILTAETIRRCLIRAGHEVTGIAESFSEAVDAVNRHSPDAIIMDIELGDAALGGIEVMNEINADIPVVFLTGKTDRETFSKASETAASAFLTKPFRDEDLVYQVELVYKKMSSSLKPAGLPGSFYIFDRKSYIKINKKEVVYLEASKTRTLIYLRNKPEAAVASMNLGYLEQYFRDKNFIRITNSLIINEDHLSEMKDAKLFFDGTDRPLEISESKRAALKKKLTILKSPH